MHLIRENPITAMLFAFFLSSCAFSYIPLPLKLLCIGAALLCFVLLLFPADKRKTSHYPWLLVCGACAAAGIWSSTAYLYAEHLDSFSGCETEVTLQITESEYQLSYAAGYIARVEESDILPESVKIRLYTPMTALEEGSVLKGTVSLLSISENSGSFDGRSYYLPDKVMLQAEDISLSHVDTLPSFSVSSLFRQIRQRLTAMILAHTSPEAGGLASAVLLGDRDHLEDAMERDFRRLGITHLLVVSGTHFSVLVSMADTGLKRFRIPPKLRCCISMGIILLIMLLTGLTPSVVRAGIMHLMAQLSLLLVRKSNLIHSFAFSGALMVLINPYAAMDCGLQLSFAAASCCILFQIYKGSLYRFIRIKTGIRLADLPLIAIPEAIACTCMVSLSTLPLIWLYFGEVSLFSIPANLIFTPLISLLMLFTAAYLILYPLYLLILPMAAVLSGFCALLGNLAEFLARPDWVMIPVNYRFSVFFLLPMTVMFLLIPFVRRRMKVRLAVSSLLTGVLFFSVVGIIGAADRPYVSFSYLSDRKNDGFVLKSDGRILLCESSDASFGFSGLLTDEMSELHACEIDTLLLTHYHNKHVQLVNRLSEREILRNLVLPEPTDERETDIYRSLCENAALHRVRVTTLETGAAFDFCGVAVTLFERAYLSRSSHPVTAVSLELNGDRLTMVSSSFNQSVPEITSALESSEYLIFGGHSPVYKKTFGLSFSEKPKAMVVHSDAYSFMDEELKLIADSVRVPAPFRLRVRRNG